MSDIPPVVDAPTETAEPDAPFDLDAALTEAETTAPDEWRAKVGKINSEVKGLRERANQYRALDELPDDAREPLLALVDLVKGGQADQVARWMLHSAKNVSEDRFDALLQELTPAQQAELAEEIEATDSGELTPTRVQELVRKELAEARKADDERRQLDTQVRAVEKELSDLGYDPRSDDARYVLQMARADGDIAKAHERFETRKAEWAKRYLQDKGGDASLVPDGAQPAQTNGQDLSGVDPKERIMRRLNDMAAGAGVS
jgi:hypothetical protein